MPDSLARRTRARPRQLFLETLETRSLLATFSPTPLVFDTRPGSLRAAIIASNGNNQNDTINLNAGRYLLDANIDGVQENAATTGDLDLTDAGHTVTIQGKGAATIIDGNQIDRVFQVFPNVQLVLKDVVLRNGLAIDDGVSGHTSANSASMRGGAILTGANSSLTLTNVLIESCAAGYLGTSLPAEGGAIYSQGAVVITNSTFLLNSAQAGPGTATTTSLAQGGAIAAFGSTPLQITDSAFTSNSAQGGNDGGAGAGLARGGGVAAQVNVVVSGSMFANNLATAGENQTQAAGADASGGGLYVNGNATLAQVQFNANAASGGRSVVSPGVLRGGNAFGGGVFAKGITATSVTLQQNAAGGGPAYYQSTPPAGASGTDGGRAAGGGIYLTANSSFTDLTLTDNIADAGEGASGIAANSGSSDNGGNGGYGGRADGGGLFASSPSNVAFTRLICTGNLAIGGFGGHGGDSDQGSAGGVAGAGGAGGIAVGGGLNGDRLSITNSSISGNSAVAGDTGKNGSGRQLQSTAVGRTGFAGGVFAGGPTGIIGSSIVGNVAQGASGAGGATSSSDNAVAGAAGGNGGDALGGGLYSQNALTIRNSTISTNTAAAGSGGKGGIVGQYGGGGGSGGHSRGGGIYVAGGTAAIRNSTIAKNNAAYASAGSGGDGTTQGILGVGWYGDGGGVFNDGTVNASSTIFGDNTAGGIGVDFSGAFASASNNLLERGGGATGIANNASGNIVGQDARLGPLGFHGGLTQTHVLLAGSPAINKGDNSQGLTTDQRGLPRVVGGRADIGAVEVQLPVVTLGGTATYVENAPPLVLASGATVTAQDRDDFSGGKLTIAIAANASADDRVLIKTQGTGSGQISVSGANVMYGGNLIGTVSGGSGNTPLVIKFTTTGATPAAVQALVRAIAFRNISEDPTTTTRTITFLLADRDGLASDPTTAKKFVKVTALPN